MLETTLRRMDLEGVIKNGFETTGLHPFTIDALKNSHLFRITEQQRLATDVSLESRKFLQQFEEKLGKAMTESFRKAQADGHWMGELENRGLFHFWLNISRESSNLRTF